MVRGETAAKPHRRTAQKAAIRAALERTDSFVSAQDLHAALREEGIGLGLAMVYRNLNEMVQNGEADVLQAAPNVQLYRFCGDAHHHHLYCIECGMTIEVEAPIEAWVDEAARAHGFARVRHVVDIFGVCPDCQAREAGRPAADRAS